MATESVENLEPIPATAEKEFSSARRRRIIIFVVVTLLNISLLVLLWTQLLAPRAGAPQSASSLTGNVPTQWQGKAAPNFTLPTMNGTSKQLSLADLKGKVVMLNFWSSDCVPCQQEAPFLQRAWTKLQAENVVLVGINIFDKQENAMTFLQTYGITYPNVQDTANGATAINYGATGQPETFFIDKNGTVTARWSGPLTEDALRTELARVGVRY